MANPRDDKEVEAGKKAQEEGRPNPHHKGTRAWFAFEDGRAEAGAKDVGTAPGNPAWG